MHNLKTRTLRLEAILKPIPVRAFDGYSEAAKGAIAKVALEAAVRVNAQPPFTKDGDPETKRVALEAANAMIARLEAEGLLYPGPNADDARVRQLADETIESMGPHPYRQHDRHDQST